MRVVELSDGERENRRCLSPDADPRLSFTDDAMRDMRRCMLPPRPPLTEPRGVRRAYLAALDDFLERIQTGCRSLQVDYRLVQTNEPFDATLRHLLTSRSARRG